MATVVKKSKKKHLSDDNGEIKKKKSKKSDSIEDWNIDDYRTDYESEEHWELRRKFMEVHKDKFPEERLVCLARVFTNIEFMGCRYPQETMRLVAELSKDVAKNFRESRESRLKRTFVAASDAAEQRAKGRRGAQSKQQQQRESVKQQQKIQNNRDNKNRNILGESSDFFEGLPYEKFILYLKGGRQCLLLSAARANTNVVEKVQKSEEGLTRVDIYIKDKLVASEEQENLKLAKAAAFKKAVEVLQKNCYSIKQNGKGDTIKIEKTDEHTVNCEVLKEKKPDKKLDETNKGYRMMKMMGWSGGGLGASKQGREDPVGYLFKNNRVGLGMKSSKVDDTFFTDMLKNYTNSDDIRELRFESSFTKDERALLHSIAQKFNLKSQSYGNSENRHLVVSKKTITNEMILREVLLHKNPAYCDQYLVQVPEAKAHLYPDHTEHLELEI